MKKVKNTIPVYDICAIGGTDHVNHELIAEPFGAYLQVHPNLYRAHRHSFYHVVLFTKGGGYHTIDFERFEVQPGQIYFMIPGQVHSWSFEGDVDGFVINFSEALFRSFLANDAYLEQYGFFRGIAQDSVYQLTGITLATAISLFEQIVQEAGGKDAFTDDAIRACLLQLFVTVQRTRLHTGKSQTPQQNHVILFNFRKLIDQHYAEKRLPKEYAAMLYITPNHLNALCKDLLGKPAGELIRDRILLESKRLLINADKSIADIAEQLSFADNSHFTKFFKKYTLTTPESFRSTSLNNSK